jgi:L-lactate dehydrogenase complex protein LldG
MVEDSLMSEADNILARIREALAVAAPVPGHPDRSAPRASLLPDAADHRRVLPAVGASVEEQLALFQKNAAELRADFRLVKDRDALAAGLKGLCVAEGWQRVASHHGGLAEAACSALGLPVLFTNTAFDPRELGRCDAGISECDALIAQTGSVVVTSRSAGGRALSVLPPHHVVLARRAQLVPDLPAAFRALSAKYGASYPSMISLITGPSRTGDIERILVLGAHGPKKLTIFCL